MGYNRDLKRNRLQVNYGLLTNRFGVPVSVSVYKGNTGDPKTLLPQVDKLRNEFGIKHFVLVGDRGMIMQKQINALKEFENVDWITALRTEAIRKLADEGDLQMDLFDERNLFEIENHPDYEGERLVVCRNPVLAHHRAEKRKALLEATNKELKAVQLMVERGRLRGTEAIHQQLKKAVSSKVSPHVSFAVRDDGFEVSFDEKAIISGAIQSTVTELHSVQRMAERSRLRGKKAIGERIDKILARRKVGGHFQIEIREDGFNYSIDEPRVLADALASTYTNLDRIRTKIKYGHLSGQDTIGVRVGKVIDKYKVGKHFILDIRDDSFSYALDEEKVRTEAELDGIYIVRTSVPKQLMDSDSTVRSYKSLTKVERAFRSMKTFDLMVRPIYHNLESRVRAHIFLCTLSYYVMWHIIEAWRPLLFCDEDQAAKELRDPVAPAARSKAAMKKVSSKQLDDGTVVHSFKTLMDVLGKIVRNICRRVDAPPNEPTFTMVTPCNAKQQKAYDLLDSIKM